MGRMKDMAIDLRNLEMDFIDLVGELFKRDGYRVTERSAEFFPGPGPDLAVSGPDGEQKIIELKLHRSERVPSALLRNAYEQLSEFISKRGAAGGLLVVTQPLVESHYSVISPANVELRGLMRE
ncbi:MULTISPECIES: hypothetical protein [unclassified Mesorhizobium]|uniref:hypothetical protein n=1 Tax=unclassified Mesorhizobium TaxID=325217 RepID=UPI000FE84513|nr:MULTISPECIES: hypothetical protein [unclassified Mesorhizobium]RWB98641.1 MAG: hypothetical protein EOQ57_20695 [Mesorhizobium sp.]TGV21897.1 hypothetical protein EN786_31785 [Mesorhizobium sp. M4B.F.Ca.ET.143.01.1.1]